MKHLYLIRHARAEGRKPGIIGLYPPNAGLSPLGVMQAKSLRDRLVETNEMEVDFLVSSPLSTTAALTQLASLLDV